MKRMMRRGDEMSRRRVWGEGKRMKRMMRGRGRRR